MLHLFRELGDRSIFIQFCQRQFRGRPGGPEYQRTLLRCSGVATDVRGSDERGGDTDHTMGSSLLATTPSEWDSCLRGA